MLRKNILIVLLFFIVSVASAQERPKEIITNGDPIKLKFIEGVTITPPAGYTYLEDMSSFLERVNETSISVTKNDSISYYLMVGGILKSDFSGQDTKLLSKEQVSGKMGMLFTFLFKVQGIDVERLVYVTGDENMSISISANYKSKDKALVRERLKKSILSVEF